MLEVLAGLFLAGRRGRAAGTPAFSHRAKKLLAESFALAILASLRPQTPVSPTPPASQKKTVRTGLIGLGFGFGFGVGGF
jgi:hypothetical protein